MERLVSCRRNRLYLTSCIKLILFVELCGCFALCNFFPLGSSTSAVFAKGDRHHGYDHGHHYYDGHDHHGKSTTYYVRKTGSDHNDGTAPNKSFKTITKAALVVTAGDTVYVGAGTYTDAAAVASGGASTNVIRFVADTDGTETGDAGDVVVAAKEGFKMDGDDYIEIVGFVFDGKEKMVSWKNSLGCVLADCEFRNGKSAVYLDDSRVTIDNCHIHDNDGDGIEVKGSSSVVTISNCLVQNGGGKGILIKDASQVVIEDTVSSDNKDHGVRVEADGSIVTVSRCVFQRNKDGFHSHGQHQVALDNCLMTDNAEEGFQIHAKNPSATLNHCTIVGNGAPGIDCSKGIGWIRNTIVAFNADEGIQGGGSFTGDYNLVYGNSGGDYKKFTGGSHDVVENPKFLGSGNYRLKSGSPAIDAGTDALAVDLDGTSRPQGKAVDIGCYEIGPLIYYVRTSGNDSNTGLSPDQAFLTISRAASVVVAGTVVHVGGGSYLEGVVIQEQATSDDPILFIADVTGAATGDAGPVVVTPQADQQYGWTIQNAGYVSLDGFRISGSGMPQANGLLVENSAAVTIESAEIDSTIHGLLGISSSIILQDCVIRDATTAGLWLNQIDDADLQVNNLTLKDNGTYGLYADTCVLTFSPANFNNWAITGSEIAIAATDSNLTFESVTISGGAVAGAQLNQSILTANQATFSGNGYGLASDASNVVLTNCTFSGNVVGLYANQGSLLSVSDSTFTANTVWGASVTPSGNTGETSTFSGCTFAGNAGGLSLVNATDGDVCYGTRQ